MLPPLPGWTRQLRGGSLLLLPPEGAEVGHIRYRERVRPLRRVRDLVRELVAALPAFQAEAPIMEPLVTSEGEYAALVHVGGILQGKPAQRTFGFVFGDDFYARISALCLAPEHFTAFGEAVRRLTLGDSQLLGVRRRRYLYDPPPRATWHGIARLFQTDWMPIEYPRDHTMLTVFPANPVPASPQQLADNLIAEDRASGWRMDRQEGPFTLQTAHGLFGGRWVFEGQYPERPATRRHLVILQDRRYLYALTLDAATPETRPAAGEVFDAVVRSVRPLPDTTQPAPRDDGGAMAHWL